MIAALTWTGSTLLLVGFVHVAGWNTAAEAWLTSVSLLPTRPVLVATLAHGIVAAVVSCLLASREPCLSGTSPTLRWRQLVVPLMLSAMASSVLALPWSLLVFDQQFGQHAWYMAALALVWLAAAVVQLSPLNFSVFQSLATVAVVFTAASVCQQQYWWSGRLYEPLHLHAQFGTLAVWCLAWSAGRRLARRRWPSVVGLMRWNEQAVDECLLGAAAVGMFVMCVVGCTPGAASELGMSSDVTVIWGLRAMWESVFVAGAWIALVLLAAAVVSSLIERFSMPMFSALFVVASIAALLIGGRLYETLAVASGLRWSFALLGVVLTIAVCLGSRIEAALRRLAWLEWGELPGTLSQYARSWTLGFTAIPILGLTTASLVQAATGNAPHGPTADSFFAKIGSELSFGVPMGLLAGIFIAHAVREKQTSLMLAGSGVFQYLVNLAYFLPILKDPSARFDWPVVIGCLQWNSLGLAGFALAWLGARRWVEPRDGCIAQGAFDRCLSIQVVGAVAAVAATTGLATAVVVAAPNDLTRCAEFGSWLSYLVCLLGFGAAAWLTRSRLERFGIPLLLGFLFAIGGPVAISLEGNPGSWHAYHVLMLAWLIVAIAATLLAWLSRFW